MTIYEAVSLNGDLLKTLHGFGISIDDYKWLGLYREYLEMRAKRHKVTYIVAKLSKKHGICERKAYRLIRKMEKDCKIGAVE